MGIIERRVLRTEIDGGTFICPKCADEMAYTAHRLGMFNTLWGVKLFASGPQHEFVRCTGCECLYTIHVLDAATPAQAALEEARVGAVRRVLVNMTLADGAVASTEIDEIRAIFLEMTGQELSEVDTAAEVSQASFDGQKPDEFIAIMAVALDDAEKLAVTHAALRLAISNGDLAEEERQRMTEIVLALGGPPALIETVGKSIPEIQAYLDEQVPRLGA